MHQSQNQAIARLSNVVILSKSSRKIRESGGKSVSRFTCRLKNHIFSDLENSTRSLRTQRY